MTIRSDYIHAASESNSNREPKQKHIKHNNLKMNKLLHDFHVTPYHTPYAKPFFKQHFISIKINIELKKFSILF